MASRLDELHLRIARAGKKLPYTERLEIGAKADDQAQIKEVVVLNQAQITTTAREREEDDALKDARKAYLDLLRPYSKRASLAKASSEYATLLMSLPSVSREQYASESRAALKKRAEKDLEQQLEGRDPRKKADD